MLFICTRNLRGSLFASQSSSDSTGYEANGRSRDAYPNNTICKLGPTKFNITSFCSDQQQKKKRSKALILIYLLRFCLQWFSLRLKLASNQVERIETKTRYKSKKNICFINTMRLLSNLETAFHELPASRVVSSAIITNSEKINLLPVLQRRATTCQRSCIKKKSFVKLCNNNNQKHTFI